MSRIRTARRCTCTSALAVVLAACGGGGRPIPYADVSPLLRPVEFPHFVRRAFVSRDAFDSYFQERMPGRAPHVPPVDFARQELVLVALGPRSSTGYALRIVSVRDTGGSIAIVAREETPTLGDRVVARVVYPFKLLRIPRLDEPVTLHLVGRP